MVQITFLNRLLINAKGCWRGYNSRKRSSPSYLSNCL